MTTTQLQPKEKSYNRAAAVDQFFQQIQSGSLPFSDIHRQMSERGYESAEINAVAMLVDNLLRHEAVKKSERSRAVGLMITGTIALLVGLGITLYTWFAGYLQGGWMVIAFGPVVGGAGAASLGYERWKRFS